MEDVQKLIKVDGLFQLSQYRRFYVTELLATIAFCDTVKGVYTTVSNIMCDSLSREHRRREVGMRYGLHVCATQNQMRIGKIVPEPRKKDEEGGSIYISLWQGSLQFLKYRIV